jgi:sarcosine oxidase subunit beta
MNRDPAELPLARAAVDIWVTLNERLDADVEYRRGGNVRLARTPDEVAVIRKLVAAQRALGLDLTFLDGNAAVRDVAPALSPTVLAASFCPTDGHANPVLATRAFAADARRHGATVREGIGVHALVVEGARVTGVQTADGFVGADAVVVAAGVNTPALLAPLGLHLSLSLQIVHVVQTAPLAPCFAPAFGVANADCAGRQEADGRLRFTNGRGRWPGDADAWSEAALKPSADDVRQLVDRVARFLPVVGTAPIARTWGGLIDLTPDALPVIDAPPAVAGLVVAAGFSGHGFCLGPVSGQLCADLALRRAPRHDVAAFRLDRFVGHASAGAALTLHG